MTATSAVKHSMSHTGKRCAPGKENLNPLKALTADAATVNVRSRRDRPCDACRRRKSRCVIKVELTACVLCEFHKQDCTFLQSPLPRKRKLPSDVKKEDATPKKRAVEKESRRRAANQAIPSPPPSTESPCPSVDDKSIVPAAETLGLQTSRYGKHIGLTFPLDPAVIALSAFNDRDESESAFGTLRRVSENDCFIMLADDIEQEQASQVEALNAIEGIVAPHGAALLELYFRAVHPTYPIVQKPMFWEHYESADPRTSPPLLACMYLLALNWWSQDPKLTEFTKPDADRLRALASDYLALAIDRPRISTVQAGLLFLQRPDADSWSLTTQLVAVGQELGLHLDCSTWTIPPWEKVLRKRLAWALYMQDKWSSLIHGRPSHILAANWAVTPVDEDPGSGEGEDWTDEQSDEERKQKTTGHMVFAQMVSLTTIMAEVMDTFYTQSAVRDFENAGKRSTALILERAKPVQIKLKEWFARIPAAVRMDNVSANRIYSTGYLHLAYFATEITLHRRIVQSLSPETSDPYLLYICRSAAKTRLISAMDFVNRLRPEHLQSFWFFASKVNFTLIGTFGGLLWATAPAQEEADFYRTRLREYRWTLSVSSSRAQFLDYAVQMLDASRAMLSNISAKPSFAQTMVSSAGVPSPRRPAAVTAPVSGAAEAEGGMSHDYQSSDDSQSPPPPSSSAAPEEQFSGFETEPLDFYHGGDEAHGGHLRRSETSSTVASVGASTDVAPSGSLLGKRARLE